MTKEVKGFITDAQLELIRKYLPFGSTVKMAKEFETTPQYISTVLHGKKKNIPVLFAAVEIATKEKQRRDEEKKALKQKLEKLST